MKIPRHVARIVMIILPALAAAGCGYTMDSPYPAEYKTVSVPIWHRGRGVYRRELEMRLTEAIVKQIELKTPYKVVSRPRADTELTGTIDTVEQRILTYDTDTGRPRELELTIYVTFRWKDLRNGKTIVKRANFSTAGTYITHEPFSRDFFQGSEDVINKLARRIVEQLEKGW